MGQPITPQMFGALADGTHDDTAAVQAALSQALTVGRNLYIPAGTYAINGTPPIAADLNLLPSQNGITIYGDGPNSLLQFPATPAATTDALFKVYSSASSGGEYYHLGMRDLAISGSIADPGAVLMLGDNGLYTQLQGGIFTGLSIRNDGASTAVGPALLLNRVYRCTIEGSFNSSAISGTAGLRLVNASYNRISASVGAAGYNTAPGATNYYGIGIHLTSNNLNASNTFVSSDCESVWTGIQIDSAGAQGNVFVAPWCSSVPPSLVMQYGIYVSAGGNQSFNRFIQPTFAGLGFVQDVRTSSNTDYVVVQT